MKLLVVIPAYNEEGSLAATARAVDAGCALVRVHDVRAHARLIKVLSAML